MFIFCVKAVLFFCLFAFSWTIECDVKSEVRNVDQSVSKFPNFDIKVTCHNIQQHQIDKFGIKSVTSFFLNLYQTVASYWNNIDFGGNFEETELTLFLISCFQLFRN